MVKQLVSLLPFCHQAVLAAALSGIGIIAGPPLAGLAAWFSSILIALIVKSKKLNSKIRLFSKGMKDGSISDVEFDLNLHEIEQYYSLKKSA